MSETIEKIEEPEALKDGVASVPAATVSQDGKVDEVISLPAAAIEEECPVKDPLLEPEPEMAAAVEICDEKKTKDAKIECESVVQGDIDKVELKEPLPNETIETKSVFEATIDSSKKETPPLPAEPMDTSNNDLSEKAEVLEPAVIDATSIDESNAVHKQEVVTENEPTLKETKVTQEKKEESSKEVPITIADFDKAENMDTVLDSPESQLVIAESKSPRERSTSPEIGLSEVPDINPSLTLKPTPLENPSPVVLEQKNPTKPPSPTKLGTNTVVPKELVIPKDQLDILKRHLNQEQYQSLKELAEQSPQKKPSPEKQKEIPSSPANDKMTSLVPEKREKVISPVLEKHLTLQRIPEIPTTSTQKVPSPEISTPNLSTLQILTQKLPNKEAATQKLPNSEVVSQKRTSPQSFNQNPPSQETTTQKRPCLEISILKQNNQESNKHPDLDPPQKLLSPTTSITKFSSPEKLPSPSLEVAAILKSPVKDDVDMVDAADVKAEEKKKPSPSKEVQTVNGDVTKDDQPTKRRASEEVETESPLKKLCQEVERSFPHHDSMVNDYIQNATKNNIDEIQKQTEQLLAEIQTLRELAQKKEHEWNNILHLKKVKEEILLRLLRKKQVISFEKAPEVNGSGKDPFDYLNQGKSLAIDKSDEISGLALKQPIPPMSQSPIQSQMVQSQMGQSQMGQSQMGQSPMAMNVSINSSMSSPLHMNPPISSMSHMMQPPGMPVTSHFNPLAGLPPPYDKVAHMQQMQKPVYPQTMMMAGPTMPGFPRDMNGQLAASYIPMGRQGPTKDVKSIIADYRQRNPDLTPRRGRRMKSSMGPGGLGGALGPRQIAPKVEALGNLGMIFNNLDMNQKAMLERLTQMQAANLSNGMSFKDVLVQFASMQGQPLPGMMPGPGGAPGRPESAGSRLECAPSRPEMAPNRDHRPPRRPDRHQEELHMQKQAERERATVSPRLPPPPPYPEISLLPVSSNQDGQQNSLLHGILTKNCGEITITPVQPPEPAKHEEVVQLDDEESPASEGSEADRPEPAAGAAEGAAGEEAAAEGEGEAEEAPLCQGCRKRDAQFVCAGCANQWYCSRDCQVAAWDEHSEMCSG